MKIEEKQKVFKRLIIVCWIALAFCFIIKLCGGNYFEIIAKNQTFINVCNWLEATHIGDVIKLCVYTFNLYIIICIFSKQTIKGWRAFILILISIPLWILKRHFALIGAIIETLLMICIPIFVFKNKKVFNVLLGYLLVNVFQLASLFIKNIDSMIIKNNFLIGLIYQIDYYIMLILYYLYSIKMKGEIFMDWGVLWLGDNQAMDKGYTKFIKITSTIGIILTFPISVPYMLWKKHKANKMIDSKE